MSLGIVVAMPAEARSLTQRRLVPGEQAQLQENISLHLSGIGPKRARRAAEALLENGSTALLSWGTAGGLIPGLFPGVLIIPRRIIAADQTYYDVDLNWHAAIIRRLSSQRNLHTEPVAESAGVLASPAEKKALSHRTGAVAVDMESAAIAAVARGAKVPFMAVRAIVDSVDRPLPKITFVAFSSSGQLSLPRVLKGLLQHPMDLFGLARLGLNFRAAQGTLATVACIVGYSGLLRPGEESGRVTRP
jgi:adenosylhomocysteine nucleosidase